MIHFSFTHCSPGGIADDVGGWTFWVNMGNNSPSLRLCVCVCVCLTHTKEKTFTFAWMCAVLSHGKTTVSLISQSVTCKSLHADVSQVGEHETADCECGKTLVNS